MAKVAVPSMRRFGYADSLAAGSVAAGGTLGILIPPSVTMVIYGILTQQNIGKLFIAGLLPGLVAIACYLGAVWSHHIIPSWASPPAHWSATRCRLLPIGLERTAGCPDCGSSQRVPVVT